MNKPNLHVLDMGETGSGKSTFARSFPKPTVVMFFDSLGKDMPYMKGAVDVGKMIEWQYGKYRDVTREDGVVRLEYYHSESPYQPDAYSRFMARMGEFHKEYKQWKTLVCDSTTSMELEARKWHQYVLNPSAKDGRQWFGGSTDLMEEMVMMRFSSLPMNVLVLTHIDEDKDELYGEIVSNPSLPGRLRKRIASAYSEHYRSYVQRGDDGKLVHMLQTQHNGRFASQSQIDAPNPSWPLYDGLWGNWEG